MSNIQLVIEERASDIGNFMVGRLLPFRQKRMVGPFIFIDHMGPACMSSYENLDVPPHPHIGLSTLTYLFEGSMMHRDSLGNAIEIKPGQVNWMTAGKGIVHSERTPEYLRTSDKMLHGLQIWVALPKEKEFMEPEFVHFDENDLPVWEDDEITFKLIAGEVFGRKSPVPVYSPLYLVEIKSKKKVSLNLGKDLFGETAMYILEGTVEIEDNIFGSKKILVAKNSSLCEFTIDDNTTLYIFGGEAFPEERFIYWNFVASNPETINRAKQDWKAERFPVIQGESAIVPLPD